MSRRKRRVFYQKSAACLTLLAALALQDPGSASQGPGLLASAWTRTADQLPRAPRLVLIKIDGLPALFMEAMLDPEGRAVRQLPEPREFRLACRKLRQVYGRDELLPNLHEYFLRQGVRTSRLFSGTVALSAPAWAMLDSGQPGIVKNHYQFSRATGQVAFFLDGFRDSLDTLIKGAGKTSAVWQLDLLGVPILNDAFPDDRSWTSIQILYRNRPNEQVSHLGRFLLKSGAPNFDPLDLIKRHLSKFVYHPDYPEWNDIALTRLAAKKILERGPLGDERLDFISVFFATLDHQFHVDANYERLAGWLIKIDSWVGEILAAVEQSERREDTLVAVVSDHGVDYHPVKTHYSFPINRWLREAEFGGHTTLSPHTEDSVHALSMPVRGLDSPKVYESPASSYGPGVQGGASGYFTAFTANAGNPRFDAFFRNSDLNALHLLLLEARRVRDDESKLQRLLAVFRNRLEMMQGWLESESERLDEAASGLASLAAAYEKRGGNYEKDAAARLKREAQEQAETASALRRLLKVPVERLSWSEWVRSGFEISSLIPKGYLGPPNRIEQLQEYVAGWDEPDEQRWEEGPAGFRTINYPDRFSQFRATNPNAWGNHFPFNFVSVALPVDRLHNPVEKTLGQAVWIIASNGRGQALILESTEGDIQYLPIRGLQFDGQCHAVDPVKSGDPSPFDFDRTSAASVWLTPGAWARVAAESEYTVAPVILADLFRPNFESALRAPELAQRLQRLEVSDRTTLLRALDTRYRQEICDLRVWMNRGWNVNANNQNPGGSHGGFTPLETRPVFMLWGGRHFPLRRGETIDSPVFTTAIAPTLLQALGLLENRRFRVFQPAVFSSLLSPPLPGEPMDVFTATR